MTCTLESAWDLPVDFLHAESGISGRGNNRNEDSELRHQVLYRNSEKLSLVSSKETSINEK